MSYGHASDLAQRIMGRNLRLEAENDRLEHQVKGLRKASKILEVQRDAARAEARRLRASRGQKEGPDAR